RRASLKGAHDGARSARGNPRIAHQTTVSREIGRDRARGSQPERHPGGLLESEERQGHLAPGRMVLGARPGEPAHAQAWDYSSDGLDITYRVRPGVRWHDGQAFSSDDVKFTFDLIHAQNLSEYSQWLVDLTGVETPDANTVVLRFAKPQAFNPGLAIPILPKHIWGGKSIAEIQKFANQTPI